MTKVPRKVLEGLEEVQESGELNMFAWKGVMRLASDYGFPETVIWVFENRAEYITGLMEGFCVDEEFELMGQLDKVQEVSRV